jgi:hypothetical protein
MEYGMISTQELKNQKEKLENALNDVGIALAHPEYRDPFVFKRMDRITTKHLSHSKDYL